MVPQIVERPSLLVAGIMNCDNDLAAIDIHGLWDVFTKSEAAIPNRIEGSWYELHIGNKLGCGSYSIMAGTEIREVGALPIKVSLNVVPAGRYAYFAHRMKDGGFKDAFVEVDTWVKECRTEAIDFGLQRYDRDFDLQNENSILHIYIPLEQGKI